MSLFSKKNILVIFICFGGILLKAQILVGYWTIAPPKTPNPWRPYYTFCKGECVQFIDSSFYINAPPNWPDSNVVIKRYWAFSGTSKKRIPKDTVTNIPPQPIYPYASDTFAFSTKQNPPLLCYDSVGTFAVYLTFEYSITGLSGGTIEYAIQIIDAPYYTAPDTQNIKVRFPETVTLNACATGDKYKWGPAEEGTCNNCPEYSIQPFSNTTYICTISNNNDCEKKCFYNVEVEDAPETLFIPTAFSPNNDGINDVFKPLLLNKKITTLTIYNRWGEKIFESRNADAAWDGKIKNEFIQEDIYTYNITYTSVKNDTQKIMRGLIAVIR